MLLFPRMINCDIEEGKGNPHSMFMVACEFDFLFIYVLTSWEGSAHDSRIFIDAIDNPSLNFPKPSPGNFLPFS